MARDELYGYSPKESEKEERRDKKRRPRMNISGRSVLGLAQMIINRTAGPAPQKKKRKRKRKK